MNAKEIMQKRKGRNETMKGKRKKAWEKERKGERNKKEREGERNKKGRNNGMKKTMNERMEEKRTTVKEGKIEK